MAIKKYKIFFQVTFRTIEEEKVQQTVIEKSSVEREYDEELYPEDEFLKEFMDECEGNYVKTPNWGNGFYSDFEITEVQPIT